MYSISRRYDEEFVTDARDAARELPAGLLDRLDTFRDAPPPAGCLLLRGLPVGDLPPTPSTPTEPSAKSDHTELMLLAIATVLGEPVGYLPEHGGDIIQNIVPVESSARTQTSTSSSVDLMFHTEAAFHPHRPKYLLLFCLRGDAAARTTVASVHAALPHVPSDVVDVLFQPRFRCAIDESYLHGRANKLGAPTAVLSGSRARPAMVFDQDLMVGIDEGAEDALAALGAALHENHDAVVLETGDLLVIDNDLVVHGRSPFAARFDGTDRWLQRSFVVTDLTAIADERDGRVITTVFGDERD